MENMNALVLNGYGGPEFTRFDRVAAPQPGHGQVLVRVQVRPGKTVAVIAA